MQAEIRKERESLFADESNRRWTGILTDGQCWHCWTWEHRDSPAAQTERTDYSPASGGELATWIRDTLAGTLIGKDWIPRDPVNLFRDQARSLRDIYDDLTGEVADKTSTKQALWGDMLRSSGMYPQTEPARNRLFVSHSFLVALARGVVDTMEQGRSISARDLLSDGFVSWIVQTTSGAQWADNLLATINSYEWRMQRGDVLRPLYEEFVAKSDRRDFGEVYTPDWLAELLVWEVLDDDWCGHAIAAAQAEKHGQQPLQGVGVLDPACGSGTFLYHAARRILAHPDMATLTAGTQSGLVCRLINGIDIHPVACEFTRATLLRALPHTPLAGQAELRIYNGDSLRMQGGEQEDDMLLQPQDGNIVIISPRGQIIHLPETFLYNPDFAALVQQFTDSAVAGQPIPPHVRNSVTECERESMTIAYDTLQKIIAREGNSVWAWYITNSVGPYVLENQKVDRIVSNPPWVKIAHVKVRERHRRIKTTAEQLGLWQGGKNAPHFDIAQLFVRQCRERYLASPSRNPAAWIVKASALKAQHWSKLRKWRDVTGIAGQSVDMIDVQVFGGGDARRSCLLFDVRPSSLGELKSEPFITGTVNNDKPQHWNSHDEAMELVEWQVAPPPIPAGESYYLNIVSTGFRQGATISPQVLTRAERIVQVGSDKVQVSTSISVKASWKNVPQQEVCVPDRWVTTMVNSGGVLPFTLKPGWVKHIIVPVDPDGHLLPHDVAMCIPGWKHLNNIYTEHKGQGTSTPRTLTAMINYQSTLNHQLPLKMVDNDRLMTQVLYPSSGDIMRGCRCPPRSTIIDNGLYHAAFQTAEEAAYLVALLNTPVLERAFKESQTSGRHFHLNPWRCVPIPKYDPTNVLHMELAGLALAAEETAHTLLMEMQYNLNEGQTLPGQVALSRRIRDCLQDNGITDQLDVAARRLLPDQCR